MPVFLIVFCSWKLMQIQIKDSNNDTQTQQNFGPSCFDRALHYFLLTLRMADVIHHHSLLVTSMPKFSAFFCTKLRKRERERKKVSRKRSFWRAGSREEKHQWGLSSEAVWLLLSVSSLAAFTTCRYTSLSSFNGRLALRRGDLSGAELLLSTGDS